MTTTDLDCGRVVAVVRFEVVEARHALSDAALISLVHPFACEAPRRRPRRKDSQTGPIE